MVKINNCNKKVKNVICTSLCIVAIIIGFAIFVAISAFLLLYGIMCYGFGAELVEGSFAIIFAVIIFTIALASAIYCIILCCRSPKTIISDNEEIERSE